MPFYDTWYKAIWRSWNDLGMTFFQVVMSSLVLQIHRDEGTEWFWPEKLALQSSQLELKGVTIQSSKDFTEITAFEKSNLTEQYGLPFVFIIAWVFDSIHSLV